MSRAGASIRDGWRLSADVLQGPDGPYGWTDGPDGAGPDPLQDSSLGTGVLANWHYLAGALRRGRRVWLGAALTGLLLAVAGLLVVPPPHRASTLVILAHDSLVDPSRAMETDLGLATTRAVAESTIAELGLQDTPQELLDRVKVTSGSADSAEFTVSAASDSEAVRVLTAYVRVYLEQRSAQVTAQADAVAEGTRARITELQEQADALSARIDATDATTAGGSVVLGDLVGQRSQLVAQMGSLEQVVDDAQLRSAAVVSASRVVDPPAAEVSSPATRIVVWTMSGLIAGVALGIGGVLARALTSTRLRRRDEVSLALQARVAVGVGPTSPAAGRANRLLHRVLGVLTGGRFGAARRHRADVDRRLLARALEHQLPERGWRQRLIVGCIDNAAEVAPAVIELAESFRAAGRTLHLLDMTEDGVLAGAPVPVIRPDEVPSLSKGPHEVARAEGVEEAHLTFPSDGNAMLVLADLHPAVGVDHLLPWGEHMVVAVTGGRSDAERVGACGQMVRAAGLRIRSALLLDSDPTDVSFGADPEQDDPVVGRA